MGSPFISYSDLFTTLRICFDLSLKFPFQVGSLSWRPWPHFPFHLANLLFIYFKISGFVGCLENNFPGDSYGYIRHQENIEPTCNRIWGKYSRLLKYRTEIILRNWCGVGKWWLMSAAAWKCCIITIVNHNLFFCNWCRGVLGWAYEGGCMEMLYYIIISTIHKKFATGAGVVLGGHMRAAARKDGFRLESPLLQLHSTSPHPHSQMGRNQQRFFQKDTDYWTVKEKPPYLPYVSTLVFRICVFVSQSRLPDPNPCKKSCKVMQSCLIFPTSVGVAQSLQSRCGV